MPVNGDVRHKMIEIEIITNWVAVVANIAVAIFILSKVNRLSGVIFILWFLVLGVQFHIITGPYEVIELEVVNGEPVIIMPLWYEVFIAIRSLIALIAPVALFILAKQALIPRESNNA
jgi:hypothetical protein